MNIFTSKIYLDNIEVIAIIGIIIGVLVFASTLFYVWGLLKPTSDLKELKCLEHLFMIYSENII